MSSRFVFTEASKDQGFMSAQDILLLDCLMEGIEALASRVKAAPGAVVFLAPPIDVLLRRLVTRGQVGDAGLNEKILVDYQRRHEELAVMYYDLGFDLLVCRTELTPDIYPQFEKEFFAYIRCNMHVRSDLLNFISVAELV